MISCYNSSTPLAYPAPAYFPCPSFGVVLETENGECDLAAPLHHENTQIRLTKAERQTYCSSFSRGDLMLPEPFVVQAIAAILAPCLSRPAHTACQAVDLGGNLGVHTAYMASLNAIVDVVEPQRDLADSIARTILANCWERRVRVHRAGITDNELSNGSVVQFKGGWRLDDRRSVVQRGAVSIELVSIHSLLRHRRVELLKIDIDNSALETGVMVELEKLVANGETSVGAVIIETSSSLAKAGRAMPLATVFSRLQSRQGYHIYRLAHHLHTMEELEPWYSPCIGVRSIKYMLHVTNLSATQWSQLLALPRDTRVGASWRKASGLPKGTGLLTGRTDSTSFLLSETWLGSGAESKWASESMDLTQPDAWRLATCGAPIRPRPGPKPMPSLRRARRGGGGGRGGRSSGRGKGGGREKKAGATGSSGPDLHEGL